MLDILYILFLRTIEYYNISVKQFGLTVSLEQFRFYGKQKNPKNYKNA